MARRLLLLTSSTDLTSDWCCQRHAQQTIRINADAPRLDAVSLDETDDLARGLALTDVDAVYWRKPFPPQATSESASSNFELHQRRYLLKSICRTLHRRGAWLLVDPDYESQVPRPVQLREAARFFQVPRWSIASGTNTDLDRPRVVKSLVPTSVDGSNFLSTQRIPSGAKLSPEFTWYVQDCVEAPTDVTVVFCCGKQWSFELDRSTLGDQVDWRLFADNHKSSSWKPTPMRAEEQEAIQRYMLQLPLHFGRLDFLRDHDGKLWFLEVNANGQFGWLDPDGSLGLLHWVFDCALEPPLEWTQMLERHRR